MLALHNITLRVGKEGAEQALLKDALDYTTRHTGRPVLGVVPYLVNLGLPEEDSVTFKEAKADVAGGADSVEIAIIDLPHISNFTDFDALRIEPDVAVRIVHSLEELGRPDAVILPGSKNVITDLAYLVRSGLAARVVELAREGRTEVVGVCGGYQMLGRRIEDPHGIESCGGSMEGLGMLALSTVLAPEKTLERVAGRHSESGLALHGYEIHHGQSASGDTLQSVVVRDDGGIIGLGSGQVWGSYLHGIFDADAFRRWFIDRLRLRRGLPAIGHIVAKYDLQDAFDRLANTVRASLDMKRIYELMNL